MLVKAKKISHVCSQIQFKPTAKFGEYVWEIWDGLTENWITGKTQFAALILVISHL